MQKLKNFYLKLSNNKLEDIVIEELKEKCQRDGLELYLELK